MDGEWVAGDKLNFDGPAYVRRDENGPACSCIIQHQQGVYLYSTGERWVRAAAIMEFRKPPTASAEVIEAGHRWLAVFKPGVPAVVGSQPDGTWQIGGAGEINDFGDIAELDAYLNGPEEITCKIEIGDCSVSQPFVPGEPQTVEIDGRRVEVRVVD